ncbi:MAG: AAA family ATPase, partial [Clostridiaceae bacterium]|nr:AAA family ATPase [Clostridiaceae bacterium]
LHEQRAKLASVDYIETSIYETVRDVCDNALIGQEISTIQGISQIGKSAAIKQYIKANPDKRIVYFELPSCPSKSLFMGELAAACYVTHDSNTNQLRKYIKSAIDSRTLLILDEFHQAFLSSDRAAISIVEFVREIYNATQCGVVLCGTDVLDDNLTKGRHYKIFSQTLKRGLIHAHLPDLTPNADIKKAIAKYCFPATITPEARKLIDEINKDHGFGVILKNLRAGATLAKKQNQSPSWDHLIEAWTILQRLSRKNKGDE